MAWWIVSSKHSRDESTKGWDSRYTVDEFLKSGRFFPYQRTGDFAIGDKCILKTFGGKDFIADFGIKSGPHEDHDGSVFYSIEHIDEWDFVVNMCLLPPVYLNLIPKRAGVIEITERQYHELLGIRNFTQHLRINYRKRLTVRVSEKDVENLLDTTNTLRSIGLEIVDRQLEITSGNRIDLLCKDAHGDYSVVEIKKHGASETVGQLARYVTDVREHRAKPGQKVKALILALEVDEQLIKAARGVDFDVMLYQLTF